MVQGGDHSAPLEEGIGLGVDHEQAGLVPAGFDGRHHLGVCFALHRHAVHLGTHKRARTHVENKNIPMGLLCFLPAQDFSVNIITLSAPGQEILSLSTRIQGLAFFQKSTGTNPNPISGSHQIEPVGFTAESESHVTEWMRKPNFRVVGVPG